IPVNMAPDALLRSLGIAAPEDIDIERSEEHTSELQSRENLVCRLLLEKKKIALNDNPIAKDPMTADNIQLQLPTVVKLRNNPAKRIRKGEACPTARAVNRLHKSESVVA